MKNVDKWTFRWAAALPLLTALAGCGGGTSEVTSSAEAVSSQNKILLQTNQVLKRTAELNTLELQEADSNYWKNPENYSKKSTAQKVTASTIPVYRFYNATTSAHFYTTSESEKTNVQNKLPQFNYEGVAFYASPSNDGTLSPVYRFYNIQTGVHFYTISEAEKTSIQASLPQFKYEGAAYFASKVQTNDTIPLYRFYQYQKGFHFYTKSDDESTSVKFRLPQYNFEDVSYFVFNSPASNFLDTLKVVASGFELGQSTTIEVSPSDAELTAKLTSKPSTSTSMLQALTAGAKFSFTPDIEGRYVVTLTYRGATRSLNYDLQKVLSFDATKLIPNSGQTTMTGLVSNQYTFFTNLSASEVAADIAKNFPNLISVGTRNGAAYIQVNNDLDKSVSEFETLKANKNYKFIGQRRIMDPPSTKFTPNDGWFKTTNYNWHINDIGMIDAWDLSKAGSRGNSNIGIGIVDNYIYADHEEITSLVNIANPSTPPDPESKSPGHGTAVTSTIAGDWANKKGVTGLNHFSPINFSSSYLPNKYENTGDWLLEGSTFSGKNRVVSISLGGEDIWNQNDPDTGIPWLAKGNITLTSVLDVLPKIRNAIGRIPRKMFNNSYTNGWDFARNFAKNSDSLFIIAASNDFMDAKYLTGSIHYEVYQSSETDMSSVKLDKLPNVIVVGAYRKNKTLANYSNYGESVDIAAPTEFMAAGVGPSQYLENGDSNYGFGGGFNGTSAATPVVAGVASLIFSKYPYLSAAQVKDILIRSAGTNTIKRRDVDSNFGSGSATEPLPGGHEIPILNASAAMAMAAQMAKVPPTVSFRTSPVSPKVGDTVTYTPTATGVGGKKIISYRWSFGDGGGVTSTVGSSTAHAYAKDGIFPVQLSVTDESGIENVSTTSVQVNPTPVSTKPSLSINFSPGSLLQLGAVSEQQVTYISGKDGRYAAKFGGVSDPGYIRIPNQAGMQFTTEASFDLWARIDSMTGMDGYGHTVSNGQFAATLLAKSHDRNGVSFLSTSMTDPGSAIWTASFDSSMTGDCKHFPHPIIPIGTWNRVTYTLSSTTGIRGYLNKNLVWECASARPSFSAMNGNDLYIGKFSDYWYPLNGAIQDIRIYKKSLTAAEVSGLQ